jgi:hypothetical protein
MLRRMNQNESTEAPAMRTGELPSSFWDERERALACNGWGIADAIWDIGRPERVAPPPTRES